LSGKLLLTSAGITNDRIENALVDLIGKPIHESSALFVPMAIYSYPQGIKHAWQVIKSPAEYGKIEVVSKGVWKLFRK